MTGIALVHASAGEFLSRQIKEWGRIFSPLILISPADDHFPNSIPIGLSEHHGIHSINRMMFAALLASKFPRSCVFEYDTIFRVAPPEDVSSGMLYASSAYYSDSPSFEAEVYSHSPWIATGETWWNVFTAPWDLQHGFPDRWLGLACQNAGVQQTGLQGCMSHDREWTPEKIAEAREFIQAGGLILHGVKTEEVYRAVLANDLQ